MTIAFDFNGTLLNDVDGCFNLLNGLLTLRGRKTIDFDRYKKIFGFPIIEYYKRAGFIFPEDNFDELAMIFVEKYNRIDFKLFEGVKETLDNLKKIHKLIVISSTEEKMLKKQLSDLGIFDYFDEIIGNDNFSGNSKIQNAINYKNNHLDESIIFIGDTDHDLEVSKAINAKFILANFGHQNILNDCVAINSFKELNDLIKE